MSTSDHLDPTDDRPDPADRDAMLDLVAAYAVHAVDAGEREFVEAHLDDDPAYRIELGRHLETAASLTVDAPVPDTTWGAILSRTRASNSESIVSAQPIAGSEMGIVTPGVAKVIAFDAARVARRSRFRIAVGAAAASAIVAVPLTLQFAGGGSPSLAALATKAAAQRGSRIVSLTNDRGVSVAEVVVTADGRGYLRRDSLPALPSGQAYQLWAVTGKTPVSAGVLGRNPSVSAFTIDAPTTALALSVEPTAGSAQPTSTPVATGSFA